MYPINVKIDNINSTTKPINTSTKNNISIETINVEFEQGKDPVITYLDTPIYKK